jgi:hypothetical protein
MGWVILGGGTLATPTPTVTLTELAYEVGVADVFDDGKGSCQINPEVEKKGREYNPLEGGKWSLVH